ncbi:MAG: TaqI-like C-terminal specificity domain-containing protein [bacterium]|nr:TaqI-like C-terminal specificity domain-containing protein [bacterium]
MQKMQAQNIVKETLQNDFSRERFLYFVKNLLNKVDESKAFHAHGYVPEAYKKSIKTYERLATYTDSEDRKIDILVVYLQKEISLERARTAQRNFVARYLKDRDQKDAGLVAFVSPDPADWRFSLVKMEYKFIEGKSARVKIKEEFTPAKRWSFLVGKNENSHTAQSRLAPIVEDDQNNPTLKELEDAFSIERVTKEFFEKYRELFLRVHETLNDCLKRHPDIREDFTDKGVNPVDFSKKLLGQIVFLYFLQKKGWFGVPMNKNWGGGDKRFLRTLFEETAAKGKNYFNDYLEPLFYEALAKDRDDDFYSRFESKIPFLNGGLFDPISNYDWVNTAIDLPNDVFSNTRKTKDGDTGDGVLDIFDRYNFTVKEDEPLEKEVAIDPEMLGKVFENLLEVKDRKSKGTYYTPREIVHYMCEQSLVNYLVTELDGKVSKDDIEQLIRSGENVVEHEAVSVSKEENLEYGGDYKRLLPDSIQKYSKEIDEKLANIKVCDPAIGSGAFPVGMMNIIVKTRSTLNAYLCEGDSICIGRTPYDFKFECIQNSLYGVDIDPGAVEIAKLRLWLSLIVDEDDIKQIKPLPNLDYKIMQGNSLLEEFEGIKLLDERLLGTMIIDSRMFEPDNQKIISLQSELMKHYVKKPEWMNDKSIPRPEEVRKLEDDIRTLLKKVKKIKKDGVEQKDLFTNVVESNEIRDELQKLHKSFFAETSKTRKDELRDRIGNMEWTLIEATLKEQNKISALKKLDQFKKSNVKPFFLWKLNFSEVFEDKGGFDVVIANPPYIRQEEIKYKEFLLNQYGPNTTCDVYSGRADLFVYFYAKSFLLLKAGGVVAFISSDKFTTRGYAQKLRSFLRDKTTILSIIDFGERPIFEATVETCIFLAEKRAPRNSSFIFLEIGSRDEVQNLVTTSSVAGIKIKQENLGIDSWVLVEKSHQDLIDKLSHKSKPLGDYVSNKIFSGIKTGKNDVFIIDEQTRDELIKADPKSAEIIKRWLVGNDIGNWTVDWANKYVIFVSKTTKISDYGAIHNHLRLHKDALTQRAAIDPSRWYELQQPQTGIFKYFEEPKIIYQNVSRYYKFAYDDCGFYLDMNLFFIPGSDMYLLGVLSSKCLQYFAHKLTNTIPGGFLVMKTMYVKKFPIPLLDSDTKKAIAVNVELLVKQILLAKKSNPETDTSALEAEIDQLVYKLYDLTPKEIEIVETSSK